MVKNLFEVFLGTYNAEPWIERAIHALESQDAEPFTVKIIDNASTDGTIKILEKIFNDYKLRNKYVLIKNSKNIGAISTFLDQLHLFDSEWILMVHQDDYYHANHVSTLANQLKAVSESTSCVFTAMERINAGSEEILTPPTLSSQLSDDRLENFMLSLQISPVNFPACALRISDLKKVDTTRHTTAFNDTELLLRLMCISDFKYLPVETMHYRIYQGNSASTTSIKSNERAVFVGMNEIFHSDEFKTLLNSIDSKVQYEKLVKAIDQAINIRFTSTDLKNLMRNIAAETLIRQKKYQISPISNFLFESLKSLNLENEASIVSNLMIRSNANVEEMIS
jgi:glycosyltransferase involved in cell wall biosynthesis